MKIFTNNYPLSKHLWYFNNSPSIYIYTNEFSLSTFPLFSFRFSPTPTFAVNPKAKRKIKKFLQSLEKEVKKYENENK
jgi:hypothetical protein